MGMPFPLGLRTVGDLGDRHVAMAWAVNGFMSILGSVAAVSLAIIWGFNRVILAGALIYLFTFFVAYALSKPSQGKKFS
jgi:hypothetical protein